MLAVTFLHPRLKFVVSHSHYMTISFHIFMWRGRRWRYNSQQGCQTTDRQSSHTTGYNEGCLWIFQPISVAKKKLLIQETWGYLELVLSPAIFRQEVRPECKHSVTP